MRILIIKGSSLYGGTRMFCDLAADAFRAAGHAVEVLDLEGSPDARATLGAHAPACETDLVFTISILGEYRDAEGRTLGEAYRAPHVLWYVDYVLGQTRRMMQTPPSTALLFIDPTQVEAVKATYGPDHFNSLGFMPHAGVGEPAPDDADAETFAQRRPIRVLWSGSFQKPGTPWDAVAANHRKPLREAVDHALSVEWIAPHEALTQAFARHGLDVTDPARRGVTALAGYVDDAVRKTRRFEFLRALAKTGLPIHICGAGWEPHLYRYRNAVYEGAVEMGRMVELMRKSRIVLNTNVNFGAGSHERPFSASLAGAATVSDHSRFYDEAFAPGEIAFYSWRDLPGAMAMLKALDADPARAFEMGRAAKARTAASHTWAQRVDRILEASASVAR